MGVYSLPLMFIYDEKYMIELAHYVNAIKNGKEVICIQESCECDDLAEVETITMEWRHDSGVVIRCTNELEATQYPNNVCPECWICWEVIDSAGQDIRPMKKNFYNVCQESF
ncbi:MAG: hypothetical protein RSG77_18120, partial [Hafnia sp.]